MTGFFRSVAGLSRFFGRTHCRARGLAEGSALVAITLIALLALVLAQPGKRGDTDFNNDGITDSRDAMMFDHVISGGECET